jgi:hypothetical protein
MAWEVRRNQRFYYRKEWQRGRVRSVYIGQGETAAILAGFDAEARAEATQARNQRRAAIAALVAEDAKADALLAEVKALIERCLIRAGCYQHRGQWRRKRMVKTKTPCSPNDPMQCGAKKKPGKQEQALEWGSFFEKRKQIHQTFLKSLI